jgi:type VI secretion system protein ImpK
MNEPKNQSPDPVEPPPENERTVVIRPRPGVRGGAATVNPTTAAVNAFLREPSQPSASQVRQPTPLPALSTTTDTLKNNNAILAAAHDLLIMGPEIRSLVSHPDPSGLKEQLTLNVRQFEQRMHSANVPREQIIAARYTVCSFLDECAASTPWGSAGTWARDTLLVRFHNEAWGGEKVFHLLSKLAENVPANRSMLELIYVCISLGFEGRYRVIDNGRPQLDSLREKLYEMIRVELPDRHLSPKWQPAEFSKRKLFDGFPIWAVSGLSAVICLAVFGTLTFLLAPRSDAASTAISDIRATPARAVPSVPSTKPRLAVFLEPEIREGLVTVKDEQSKSTIVIRGDGFFRPGSSEVDSRVIPVLNRIGNALVEHPGKVFVRGHTDNQPIRSLRFPSNWELSKARALSVSQLLQTKVEPTRISAEGAADSEPIAPNDSPEGLARNRRVEIVLVVR